MIITLLSKYAFLHIKIKYIRGLFQKYPIFICYFVLVLIIIVWLVEFFKVVSIRLENALPSVIPKQFWKLVLTIALSALVVSVSSNRCLLSGIFKRDQPKVIECYVKTLQRLAKLSYLMFCQKLLHKVWWICWHIIVVEESIAWKPGCFLHTMLLNLFKTQLNDNLLQSQVALGRYVLKS